ncbi:MAG: DNA repair protein RecN, partial [Actinomycetota bacterium]
EHLAELAMERAIVSIEVAGDDPADDVTFLLAANPGSPAAPLAKVASGGELARTMLAIRMVLTDGPPILIFDEVDAGIGGTAANAVAQCLSRLAREHQVFVVTHLAQVAAVADRHIVVRKQIVTVDGAELTRASAEVVAGNERVDEVARMLSGRPDSAAARRHARELLAG